MVTQGRESYCLTRLIPGDEMRAKASENRLNLRWAMFLRVASYAARAFVLILLFARASSSQAEMFTAPTSITPGTGTADVSTANLLVLTGLGSDSPHGTFPVGAQPGVSWNNGGFTATGHTLVAGSKLELSWTLADGSDLGTFSAPGTISGDVTLQTTGSPVQIAFTTPPLLLDGGVNFSHLITGSTSLIVPTTLDLTAWSAEVTSGWDLSGVPSRAGSVFLDVKDFRLAIVNAQDTPEPSTLALLGSGLACMTLRHRRLRRAVRRSRLG
jgi:hypothetical protein